MQIHFTQKASSLESDLDTPVGLFLRLVGEKDGLLLESAETDGRWGRYSIIATDFVLAASCREGLLHLRMEDERLKALHDLSGMPFTEGLRHLMRALFITPADKNEAPITRALYGYLGYGLTGLFEPKLASVLPPEHGEASLVLPGTLIIFDHRYNRINRLSLEMDGKAVQKLPDTSGNRPLSSPKTGGLSTKDRYISAVTHAKNEIRQGEVIQVVLSVPFSAPLSGKPFELYRKLRRINPDRKSVV